MEEKQIKVEKKDGVAWLTIDNPPVNLFDINNMWQMHGTLMEANADPEVKVVVITNAGERAFTAGVSIAQHGPEDAPKMLEAFDAMCGAVRTMDKPSIAAVNGYCLGGGIEFLGDCDMVIASENSTFGHPEIKVGQVAGFSVRALPARIGKFRTMEFLLSGDRVTAHQAETWGLVNKVVPNETFYQEVENFVKRFTVNSGVILSITRKGIATASSKPPEEAKPELDKLFKGLRDTEDYLEGIKAFMEKRPPRWKNR